ncbi:MAG: hypothetical protein MAG794_00132 [Gammaproteobacteria bacterium]|nr:hypothetical protein [Gammaproteobacteria bacterium]
MSEQVRGGCLCGRVAFVIAGPFEAFHWCHCSRCRKDTGSAHASNIFSSPDSIDWLSGKDEIKRFDLPEAKRHAKAFCTHCGSPVPYIGRNGAYLIIPAGTLDGDPGIVPQDNIFWNSRASWYESGAAAEKYAEEPEDRRP